jgi:hypothetical protein
MPHIREHSRSERDMQKQLHGIYKMFTRRGEIPETGQPPVQDINLQARRPQQYWSTPLDSDPQSGEDEIVPKQPDILKTEEELNRIKEKSDRDRSPVHPLGYLSGVPEFALGMGEGVVGAAETLGSLFYRGDVQFPSTRNDINMVIKEMGFDPKAVRGNLSAIQTIELTPASAVLPLSIRTRDGTVSGTGKDILDLATKINNAPDDDLGGAFMIGQLVAAVLTSGMSEDPLTVEQLGSPLDAMLMAIPPVSGLAGPLVKLGRADWYTRGLKTATDRRLKGRIGRVGEKPLATDLTDPDTILEMINDPSWRRFIGEKMSNNPVTLPIARIVGGISSDFTKFFNKLSGINGALEAEALNKVAVSMSALDSMGSIKKIFNTTDGFEIILENGTKTNIRTVREKLSRFSEILTDEQRQYIALTGRVNREIRELLLKNSIEVAEFPVEIGGLFGSSQILGKWDKSGVFLEARSIGPGTGSGKAFFQKGRAVRTTQQLNEALADGFVYMSDDVVQRMRVEAAYKQIRGKKVSDWAFDEMGIEMWRYAIGSEEVKSAFQSVQAGIKRDQKELVKLGTQLKEGVKTKANIVKLIDSFAVRRGILGQQAAEFTTSTEFERSLTRILAQMDESLLGARKVIAFYDNTELRVSREFKNFVRVASRMEGRIAKIGVKDKFGQYPDDTLGAQWQIQLREQSAKIGETPLDIPGFRTRPKVMGTKKEIARREAAGIPQTIKEVQVFFEHGWAKDIADALIVPGEGSIGKWVQKLNRVQTIGKLMLLGVDMSFLGIQLLFLAGSHPVKFSKAALGGFRAMGSPEFLPNYYLKKRDTINKFPNLLLSLTTPQDQVEALARGGILTEGRLRPLGRALAPFKRAFDGALDVAGIEMAEALSYKATTPQRTEQIAAFVNEFRGMASRTRLGIDPAQITIESFMLLAPRYNAAMAALVVDLFSGGLRGSLARRAMTKATFSICAAGYAMGLAYYMQRGMSFEDAVTQAASHLNPASSNFMTWEMGGQSVGPGTKMRAIIKLLARMYAEPSDLRHIFIDDWTENPGLRFLRGNLAPIPGAAVDFFTGRNIIGEPIGTPLDASFWENLVAQRTFPLLVQSFALGGGTLADRAVRSAAELVGLRNYPLPARGEFNNLVEELYAEENIEGKPAGTRVPIQEIPQLFQDRIRKDGGPGQKLWQEHLKDQKHRGWANVIISKQESARSEELMSLTVAVQKVVDAGFSPKMIRTRYTEYGATLAARYKQIESEFPKEMADLEGLDKPKIPEDFAFSQYMQIVTSDDLDDDVRGYNFRLREIRLEALRKSWGGVSNELWSYVQQRIALVNDDYPQEIQQLIADREILKPYWELTDRVLDRTGLRKKFEFYNSLKGSHRGVFINMRANEDLALALKEIEIRKVAMKSVSENDIDATLVRWDYTSKPVTPEAFSTELKLIETRLEEFGSQ